MTGRDKWKRVRALQRGLMLLQELSFTEDQSVAALAERTSLPRATVLRLLETLHAQGYVLKPSGGTFRLTLQAAGLGDGFDAGVVLGLLAGPVLAELNRTIRWPADVFSFEGGAMIIQESTNARSPLSIDPNRFGGRLPMLASASGRAFLIGCSEGQRQKVLACLQHLGDPTDMRFLKDDRFWISQRLSIERGYSIRHGYENSRRTSSFGVPIRGGGLAWGSLSIRWLDSALGFSTANEQLLPAVLKAASKIEAGIREICPPGGRSGGNA